MWITSGFITRWLDLRHMEISQIPQDRLQYKSSVRIPQRPLPFAHLLNCAAMWRFEAAHFVAEGVSLGAYDRGVSFYWSVAHTGASQVYHDGMLAVSLSCINSTCA